MVAPPVVVVVVVVVIAANTQKQSQSTTLIKYVRKMFPSLDWICNVMSIFVVYCQYHNAMYYDFQALSNDSLKGVLYNPHLWFITNIITPTFIKYQET